MSSRQGMASRPRAGLGAALALLVLGLGLGGCGASRTELVPGPLSPDVNLTARWSSNWGTMTMEQLGQVVKASFVNVDGADGQLEGQLTGDLILFDWIQPGDLKVARQEVRGRGWFRVAPDGQQLEGRWGYGEEREGGGKWLAARLAR